MELYLFNPDADLALASGEANYIAPASVRRMTDDLAMLPLWYAPGGSGVLAPSAYNLDFLKRMSGEFPLAVRLLTEPELAGHPDCQPHPWGWSPALRRRMLRGGVLPHRLPSDEALARLRRQAGRDVALEVLAAFDGWPECCGEGSRLDTLADCQRYAARQQGACLFKSPWSGSGKGLQWCREGFTPSVARWCNRQLAKQGFLVAMPLYNKVYDFAMEFQADGQGAVDFIGYSLFDTNAQGAYAGSRLEPDEDIELHLARWVSRETLETVRKRLPALLAASYPGYAGYLGVDMMICRIGEKQPRYALFPCVEVNLRMNMGIVARLFCDRFVDPSSRGIFRVEAFATPAALRQAYDEALWRWPTVLRGGRLCSGYLSLTPVTPHGCYIAYVRVER